MTNWILQLVITFVLNQLSKIGTSVSWSVLKSEADAWVKAHFPDFMQAFIEKSLDGALDTVVAALGDSVDLQLIVDDLTSQDWSKAVADLEMMLAKANAPHLAAASKALA